MAPKATKLFARRTELKMQRAKEQAVRRAAGRIPWKSVPTRTGQLQPTQEHSSDGQARQPRLKVYPAFAAWTQLPMLVGGQWCSIMAADHGRSVRDADVVVLDKLSDLQLRTPCVARLVVNEDDMKPPAVLLGRCSRCHGQVALLVAHVCHRLSNTRH